MDKNKEATTSAMTSDNQYKSNENISDKENAEVIIPENTTLDTTLSLPTWGIPHLEESIKHIADIYGCSPDYVTMGQMTAISAAIRKKIQSYDGKFHNYPMIWNMIVGKQGVNKSEPLKLCLEPLFQIDNEKYIDYKKQLAEWKEGNKKPVESQIIIMDATAESLYATLGREGAITSYYDEIVVMEENKNRYTQSGESATEMAIYSNSPLYINRKGSDTIIIQNPFLNITGTIQPEILVSAFGKETYINNGYLARWMFVIPENQTIQMYNENVIDEAILERYDKYIRDIATAPIQPYTVTYTPKAKRLYADYYNSLQTKKEIATDGYEAGIYSKLQINVQRWALITYVAKVFDSKLNEGMKITDEIISYSIDCMRYFEHTSLKVREMMYRNRNMRNQPREIGKSEILRKFVEAYPKAGENKQKLADFIGISRSQVSRELNKPQ